MTQPKYGVATLVCVLLFAVAGPACSTDSRQRSDAPTSTRPKMPEPKDVPPETRQALSERMRFHGDKMMSLYFAILFLDLDNCVKYASGIAETESLREDHGKPLPTPLVALQERLTVRAQNLVNLCKAGPSKVREVGNAFGQVTETCVHCHSYYLHGEESRVLDDDDDDDDDE